MTGEPVYDVLHTTHYEYGDPVTQSRHALRMALRDTPHQQVLSHALHLDPQPSDQSAFTDHFGNTVQYVEFDEPHGRLRVQSRARVRLRPRPAEAVLDGSAPWLRCAAALRDERGSAWIEPQSFAVASTLAVTAPQLAEYARASFDDADRPLLCGAMDLTRRIFREFRFDPGATEISTPLLDVLRTRRGVCQDFAHLMVGALRSLGLSARYVSGYLLTERDPGRPRPIGADASHAWVSVWCPRLGWTDFDPTNDALVDREHITIGWGRDFDDISPLDGIVLGGGGGVQPDVGVTVRRVASADAPAAFG